MNKIQKIWGKTKGYKTKSGAILYLLLQLFKALFPDVLNETGEVVVKATIELMLLTGSADWVWRNRKEVLQWIVDLFSKKQKDGQH